MLTITDIERELGDYGSLPAAGKHAVRDRLIELEKHNGWPNRETTGQAFREE